MSATKFLISLGFITMFVVAMTTFAFKFGVDNATNTTLSDTGEQSALLALNSTIVEQETSTDSKTEIFIQSSIEADADNIKTGSPFKIGTSGFYEGTTNASRSVFNTVLGGDRELAVFFYGFLAILGILAIGYAWALWKGGVA